MRAVFDILGLLALMVRLDERAYSGLGPRIVASMFNVGGVRK